MTLLIVEDVTSGAMATDCSEWRDLAPEGAAMLRAIAEDARDAGRWPVEVLWSGELGPFPVPGVTVHLTRSPEQESALFAERSARAERTFVIAPEFDRRLERRRASVETAGGNFVGSSMEVLALCGDKLRLAEHLDALGVSTIPTQLFDKTRARRFLRERATDGVVVKPRGGAGAMNTFHVRNTAELSATAREFEADEHAPLLQPFIPGQACSVAAIVSAGGIELFPPAMQRVRYGARLTYTGGAVGGISDREAVQSTARAALEAVPGLCGFVGVDLIAPAESAAPIVVEINPRLTTSYLGYRRLTRENLALRVLDPDGDDPTVHWEAGQFEFAVPKAMT